MEILDTFIKDNEYFLTDHQINSFNTFLKNGVSKAIKEVEHPIKILKKKDKSEKNFTHKINLYFGDVNGDMFTWKKSDNLPNDCRINGYDYTGKLEMNVYVEIIENDKIVSKKNYKFDMIELPLMLHSNLCLLKGMNEDEIVESGECKYEKGGYFIIGGLEKVIVTQERPAINYIQVLKTNEDPYTWRADIRSREEGSAQVPQATYIKYNSDTNSYWVLVPYIKNLVPLTVLFRALGIETDREILNVITADFNNNIRNSKEYTKLISKRLSSSFNEGGIFYTQESALKYLATLTQIQPDKGGRLWKENILNILSRKLFPHSNHEKNKLTYKAFFLGFMVRKLILTQLGYFKPTDKDSLINRKFELPGDLITNIFRDFYSEYVGEIRRKLYNRFEYKKEYRDNFKEILTEINSSSIFDSSNFNDRLRKSFRGRWGLKPNLDENLGVIQDLQRLSYLGTMSHLRRTHLYLPDSAKLVEPRRLHCSQFGYMCPIETPDGGSISQLKHITVMSKFSSYVNPSELYPLFTALGMVSLENINKLIIENGHNIFINGHYCGIILDPSKFTHTLLSLRRTANIHYSTSISWNISQKNINILTSSGRILRPLLIYSEKDKYDINKSWNEMVNHLNGDVIISSLLNKELNKSSSFDLDKFINNPKSQIEFIDSHESNTSLIAIDISKNDSSQYTHVELSPKAIFGVSALSLPFVEHNPAHRSLFAVGQGKQAVSIYTSNFRNRMDQSVSLLYYPNKPLVHGNFLNKLHNDNLSYGFNAIVAIGTFTGYNQEDSIILNKTSVERGMFHSSYIHTHSLREEKSKFGKIIRIMNPINNPENIEVLKLKPGHDYSQLDEHGIIKKNTVLVENMIIIGAAIKTSDGWVDCSISVSQPHDEIVHNTFLSKFVLDKNNNNSDLSNIPRIAKVSTIQYRKPIIGDKFAARSAQKGTVGLTITQEDMPYSIDGIIPDIILNPHAIPTRMTFSYFHEMLSGLLGLQIGTRINATAFHSRDDISKTLVELLQNNGYENNCETMFYNGTSGIPIKSSIFTGPMFYQRLKQQVEDKIQSRGESGAIDNLTQQASHGRKVRGGLRLGEMERDSILSHGISQFLKESYYDRADKYEYKIDDEGFIVPFNKEFGIIPNDSYHSINTPFAFKLLTQELQTAGINIISKT